MQVRAEDHAEADQMFHHADGRPGEPRRKFIETKRTQVINLDV
jgi:DNA gyrase/topoisomerase IV subunit B